MVVGTEYWHHADNVGGTYMYMHFYTGKGVLLFKHSIIGALGSGILAFNVGSKVGF